MTDPTDALRLLRELIEQLRESPNNIAAHSWCENGRHCTCSCHRVGISKHDAADQIAAQETSR